MKKMLSLFLGALLLVSAALPAATAADPPDAKLAQITQTVKATLGLDTEGYSYFQGDYEEQELAPVWNLYWSGDAGSLSVTALEDGTVVSYTLSSAEAGSGSQQGMPAFPQGDGEKARDAAQAFLDRVLSRGLETVSLEEPSGLDRLDSTTYRFNGTILLNGLPSPLSYSLTVRASDNQVIRFWRDVPETTFLGNIPAASAAATQADAAKALKGTLSLRLEYVLPDSDSTQAVLYYLPDSGHEFYVDAQTGRLVDLTALEEEMFQSPALGGAAADNGTSEDTAAESGLSDAEQAGIALDRDSLRAEAVKWEMRNPGRTPRTAKQFIASLSL